MNRIILALAGISTLALSSAASAADLIVDVPYTDGVVEASGNWDGLYLGVFGGGVWGTFEDDGPLGDEEDISGVLLGLAVGANVTVTEGVVAGIVADVAWSNAGFDLSEAPVTYAFSADWAASVRGRLGLDAGAFMPYLTAGLAVAGTSYEYTSPGPIFDDSAVHIGWTVGAGVEFAVTEDVSVDLLYRYSDYGSKTYAEDIAPYDASFSTHAVTAGLNWRF